MDYQGFFSVLGQVMSSSSLWLKFYFLKLWEDFIDTTHHARWEDCVGRAPGKVLTAFKVSIFWVKFCLFYFIYLKRWSFSHVPDIYKYYFLMILSPYTSVLSICLHYSLLDISISISLVFRVYPLHSCSIMAPSLLLSSQYYFSFS